MVKRTFFKIIDLNGKQVGKEYRGQPWLRRIENLPRFFEGRDYLVGSIPFIIVEYDVEVKHEIYNFKYNRATHTISFIEKPDTARPLWLLTKEGLFNISEHNSDSSDQTEEFVKLLKDHIDIYADLGPDKTKSVINLYNILKKKGTQPPEA